MLSWNIQKANEFSDAILDPIARHLTRRFLDRAILAVSSGQVRPEGDFDLLAYVQIVSQLTLYPNYVRELAEGKHQIDEGWEAVADELKQDPWPS